MSLPKSVFLSGDRSIRTLQIILYAGFILYFGRSIFVPISFALLISFVLYPVCAWMERKGIGRMTAIILCLLLLLVLFGAVLALLIYQFVAFAAEWPVIRDKMAGAFDQAILSVMGNFGWSEADIHATVSKMRDNPGESALKVLTSAVSASAQSAVMLVLIPVYAVLILFYRSHWVKVLIRLFPSERKESLLEVVSMAVGTYYNFIKGMAIVYLVVGVLNSVGLLLLGVPHAILFGFIASILTFIPYVGIMVGSLLPVAMAWITYNSIWYPIGVIGVFTFVQYLEANVIFPVAVSSRLNVNTLVMLLSIFVGGLLWGVSGMILFVPFVGIAKLIADHNPRLKTLSMILGGERKQSFDV